MKKVFFLLACVAGLVCSCAPNTELQEYYANEASCMYQELKNVELTHSQWVYMDAMNNVIACEMFMNLSPKIGKDIASWEYQLYEKWTKRIKIEELLADRPDAGSVDYENMVKLQKCYAYNAVSDVIKTYQNRTDKSVGMEYQEICDQAITEVISKYPIIFK